MFAFRVSQSGSVHRVAIHMFLGHCRNSANSVIAFFSSFLLLLSFCGLVVVCVCYWASIRRLWPYRPRFSLVRLRFVSLGALPSVHRTDCIKKDVCSHVSGIQDSSRLTDSEYCWIVTSLPSSYEHRYLLFKIFLFSVAWSFMPSHISFVHIET